MSVLFALAAAVGWGSSDFAAGHASRRSSAVSVTILTHFAAVVAFVFVALLPGQGGSPTLDDIGWGLLAGLGGGFGAMFMYRGFSKGSMATVAPITAAGAAIVPVAAGLVSGEAIGALGVLGVGLALVAIVTVSLAADDGDDASPECPWPAPQGRPVMMRPPSLACGVAPGAPTLSFDLGRVEHPTPTPTPTQTQTPTALPQPAMAAASSAMLANSAATGSVALLERPEIDDRTDLLPARSDRPFMRPQSLRTPPHELLAPIGRPLDPPKRLVEPPRAGASVVVFDHHLDTAPIHRSSVRIAPVLGTVVPMSHPAPAAPPEAPRAPEAPIATRSVARLVRSVVDRPGIVDALLSGIGFGLFFVFISRAAATAGHWPLVGARGISVVMFVLGAFLTRGAVLPERGSRRAVVLAGVLDAAAAMCFVLSTQSGLLSVGAVLASLYPAATIVLARAVAKERITRLQAGGLVLAGLAVSFLAI